MYVVGVNIITKWFAFQPWVVSSTLKIVQIIVHSHFDLVTWLLDLEATKPVSELITQMAVELINIHLISVQQRDQCKGGFKSESAG